MLKEAVVLPAPLQPAMMYSLLLSMLKGKELCALRKQGIGDQFSKKFWT